jgi:hypothetical protein
MALTICAPHNFVTGSELCTPEGGVAETKYIDPTSIDFTALNLPAAFTANTYLDPATYDIKVALPLVVGKFWKTLKHDLVGVESKSTKPAGRTDWDVEVTGMQFKGAVNTKEVQEAINLGRIIVANLMNDGSIRIMGLQYNTLTEQFEDTRYFETPVKVEEVTSTNGVFRDQKGAVTTINIKGSQRHQAAKYLGTWASLAIA